MEHGNSFKRTETSCWSTTMHIMIASGLHCSFKLSVTNNAQRIEAKTNVDLVIRFRNERQNEGVHSNSSWSTRSTRWNAIVIRMSAELSVYWREQQRWKTWTGLLLMRRNIDVNESGDLKVREMRFIVSIQVRVRMSGCFPGREVHVYCSVADRDYVEMFHQTGRRKNSACC